MVTTCVCVLNLKYLTHWRKKDKVPCVSFCVQGTWSVIWHWILRETSSLDIEPMMERIWHVEFSAIIFEDSCDGRIYPISWHMIVVPCAYHFFFFCFARLHTFKYTQQKYKVARSPGQLPHRGAAVTCGCHHTEGMIVQLSALSPLKLTPGLAVTASHPSYFTDTQSKMGR